MDFHNIIAGKPRGSDQFHHGVSPIDNSKLWNVPVATSEDVEDAVVAARNVFLGWAARTYRERTGLLEKLAELYLSKAEDFTKLLARETGRSTQNAAIEVHWAANWLRYPSKYEISDRSFEDQEKVVVTKYEPYGVVAAICPWNFPLMLAIGKIAPAVAAGNCIIVKPSPFTPYSALKFVELAQQVFPPSVIQVVGGSDRIGELLVRHSQIQKISFTGSTETGKKVMRDCSDTMKRLTLEMAGNNASIILPDVNISEVAPQIAAGLWFNAGQVCIASRRLYIHESIYASFLEALTAATNELGKDMASNIGPIQNAMQFNRLQDLLEDCRANKHQILGDDGTIDSVTDPSLFFRPTIIDNPPLDSRIVVEEQFGPIIPCMPFSSVDDVITLANSTESGLGASIWTKDPQLATKIAEKLEVGNVFVNGPPKPDPFAPFGGHKMSGLGVEYGLEGLLSFCQIKAVHIYK